jgi:hypothetical protein
MQWSNEGCLEHKNTHDLLNKNRMQAEHSYQSGRLNLWNTTN